MVSYMAQKVTMTDESRGMASHLLRGVPVIISALKYPTQWHATEATTPLTSGRKGPRNRETGR